MGPLTLGSTCPWHMRFLEPLLQVLLLFWVIWLEVRWNLCNFALPFPWQLEMKRLFFSHTCWLFVCLLLRKACLNLLPVFWHFPWFSNTLMKIKAPCFQHRCLFTKQEFPLRKVMVVTLNEMCYFIFLTMEGLYKSKVTCNYILQRRIIEHCTRINFVPT